MVKPSKKALGKRKAAPTRVKGAKNEVEKGPTGKPKRRPDQPKKIKLRDQKVIPVPKTTFGGSDDELLDLEVDDELDMDAGSFLRGLDKNALGRSSKETRRLHDLAKTREPLPKVQRHKVRLPTPESGSSMYDFDSEEENLGDDLDDALSSATLDDDLNAAFDDENEDEVDSENDLQVRKRKRKEEEADYEVEGRARWKKAPPKPAEDVEVGRLPIKLPTGEVQKVEGFTRIALPSVKRAPEESEDEKEDEEEDEEADEEEEGDAERMAGQKGRFGRMGIAEIVGQKGWKNAQRLEAAKEQLAAIGAEILAGGELVDNGPLLTRISTFALPTVPSLEDGPLLPVPASIRGLALLSQLAVYKDLIPGYRIRQLTAVEEAEKVRDDVRRLREGEKLLVKNYKGYLKMLETEIKRKTVLSNLSLKCMCDLLASVPHFNFSENLMGVLVGRVARRTWDDDCELVLKSFVRVFKDDITATFSQTLVRLVARMIKERKFQVHPNVLGCLLHLRLVTELDAMRRGKRGKGTESKQRPKYKSEIRKQWQTKNQKKKEKELKEVQKELDEAEAEIDKEERAQIQTETLKNLFVLYFSVLKHQGRSPLLPSALEGLTAFAHFINVDFFRDLLAVLRKIVFEDETNEAVGASGQVRTRLLAIVTAFELLTGQGEAINIDLSDFVNALYGLLRPLSLDSGIENPPLTTHTRSQSLSTSALLFKCLSAIFFSKRTASAPAWRLAAFAKRLAECALFLPPASAKQAIQVVRTLMAREPKLEGMLDTERMFDGVYKPEMDDPQLANPFASSLWELEDLATRHWDRQVRIEVTKLRDNVA